VRTYSIHLYDKRHHTRRRHIDTQRHCLSAAPQTHRGHNVSSCGESYQPGLFWRVVLNRPNDVLPLHGTSNANFPTLLHFVWESMPLDNRVKDFYLHLDPFPCDEMRALAISGHHPRFRYDLLRQAECRASGRAWSKSAPQGCHRQAASVGPWRSTRPRSLSRALSRARRAQRQTRHPSHLGRRDLRAERFYINKRMCFFSTKPFINKLLRVGMRYKSPISVGVSPGGGRDARHAAFAQSAG
jgi:hypothetical protein